MSRKLTRRQYEKKIQQLILSIKEKTTIFLNDTKEKQVQRRAKSLEDLFYFAKTYFPHYITKPFGEFHKEMHRDSERDKAIYTLAGPRVHGKTVLLAVIKPIWKALKEEKRFIIFVSENKDLAKERTVAIRLEFLHNKRIRHDFGEQLKYTQGEENDFVIKAGVRFLGLGYKQPIRGKLYGQYRPDYIVIDDFESHKSQNPRISRDKLRYVREEAFGALPDTSGIIIWLGNLTRKESAIGMYEKACEEEHPDNLIFRKYKAIKDDGSLLWPEGFTHEQLEKIRSAMGTLGFERHFQMNPITEGVQFKSKWFKYYSTNFKIGKSKFLAKFDRVVTYCDPSLGTKKADYKAIVTLGFLNKRYWLLDAWIRKESILNMLKHLYDLDQEYGKTQLYMESNFWQKVLWEFIPDLSEEYGYLLPVNGIENRIKKSERIETLQPLYEWGWILHYKPKDDDLLQLEEQILNFPDHNYDDAPDALSGAVNCLKQYTGEKSYKTVEKRLGQKFSGLW